MSRRKIYNLFLILPFVFSVPAATSQPIKVLYKQHYYAHLDSCSLPLHKDFSHYVNFEESEERVFATERWQDIIGEFDYHSGIFGHDDTTLTISPRNRSPEEYIEEESTRNSPYMFFHLKGIHTYPEYTRVDVQRTPKTEPMQGVFENTSLYFFKDFIARVRVLINTNQTPPFTTNPHLQYAAEFCAAQIRQKKTDKNQFMCKSENDCYILNTNF